MKKVIVLAALMFVMFGFAATAQTPQKIGYADIEYVLSQMPQFKDVQSEIQTYQTQLQKQYEAKVQEYQQKIQDYQAQEATMLDAIKADKQREIIQLEQNIQQFQSDMQDSFMKRQETLMTPLYEKVGTAIEGVAKENGYTHILNARIQGLDIILYGDSSLDVSDQILRKMGITPSSGSSN